MQMIRLTYYLVSYDMFHCLCPVFHPVCEVWFQEVQVIQADLSSLSLPCRVNHEDQLPQLPHGVHYFPHLFQDIQDALQDLRDLLDQ